MTRIPQSCVAEPLEDIIPILLRLLSRNLYSLLDCDWLMAWAGPHGLRPVSQLGSCPDAAACRGDVFRRIDSTGHSEYLHEQAQGREAPSLVFPIRHNGRLTGVIAAGRSRQGDYTAAELCMLVDACKQMGDVLQDPKGAVRMAAARPARASSQPELAAVR